MPAGPPIEELLAAYADDALGVEESRRVEAYLAENPTAAEQVDGLRLVINTTRAVQPRPQREPQWVLMAQTIRAACAPTTQPDSWWRRLLRPRIALPSILAAAAAVALLVSWPRGGGPAGTERHARVLHPSAQLAENGDASASKNVNADTPTVDDNTGLPRVTQLAALSESELDELEVTLGAADESDAELAARWDERAPGDVEASYDDSADLFGELDTSWLDELDEKGIDALDAFLASQTG